jgi:hypothetical protein
MNESLARAHVKALVKQHSVSGAARLLGMSAATVARIAADAPVQEGTLAKVALRAGQLVSAPAPVALSSTPIPSDITP